MGQDTTGSEGRGVRGEGGGNVNANPRLWPSGRRQASEFPPLTSAVLIATCRLEFGVSRTKQTADPVSNRDKIAIGRFVVHACVAARFLRPELPVGTAFRRARSSNGPNGISQRRRHKCRRYNGGTSKPPIGRLAFPGPLIAAHGPALRSLGVGGAPACPPEPRRRRVTAFLIADPRLEFDLSHLQRTTSEFLIGSKQGATRAKAKRKRRAGTMPALQRPRAGGTPALQMHGSETANQEIGVPRNGNGEGGRVPAGPGCNRRISDPPLREKAEIESAGKMPALQRPGAGGAPAL